MKSLRNSWFVITLSLCFSGFFAVKSYSQCTVNAGPDVTKCQGQPHNPGPSVSTTGTSGTVTYSWNGTTFNPTPNTSLVPAITTTYTLTIQDGSGCIATDQIDITVLPLPVINAGPDITICSAAPTQLCASATSPNGAITLYTWVSGPPSQCRTVAPTAPTTYTVTAVDAAGCQKSDALTVFIYPLPFVSAGSNVSMCLSQGTTQFTGSPSGGTWSGPGVDASGLFTATTTGSFDLIYSYTNSNNCSNTAQTTVTVSSPSAINGGPDVQLCRNTSAYQLPTVGTWSGSTFVTAGGLFTPSTAGTYSLTVTSGSGGCSMTDNVIVNVLGLPSVNAGVDIAICNGNSASLNATATSGNGAINNVSWAGASLNNSSILNPIASPSLSTNYILTITDASGCIGKDTVVVTVNSNPTVSAGSDITFCSNSGPQTLTGFSPTGGTWSGSGVNSAGVFTPSVTGTFTLTYSYTNASGCSSSGQRQVTVIGPGVVDGGSDVVLCLNSPSYQLTTGGTWSGSTGVTSSGVFTPGAVGNYNLTYTASTGQCTASDQVLVQVKSLPNTNAGLDQNICAGLTAQLSATVTSANGAITTYSWVGGTVSNASISNPTTSPGATTNFTLTATDVSGCASSDAILLTVNATPVVNAGNDLSTCLNGGNVGMAGFSPTGGSWSGSNVDINGVFSPTSLGSFSLTYTFTNSNNCTASDVVVVSVINAGPLEAGPDQTVCHNTAPVQLNTGGAWSGSLLVTSGGLFTPTTAGNHTLTFSAMSGGCMATDQLVITVRSTPVVNAGADVASCAGSVVNLNGSATASTGTISSYNWNSTFVSNSAIPNPTITVNSNITLTLTATDMAGCVGSDQVDMISNPLPLVDAGIDVSFCDQGITQQLTGSSPSGGTWSGSFVTSSGTFNPQTVGTYTLNYCYTNAFNCSACDDKIVTVMATTYANAGNDVELCQGGPDVNLQAVSNGGSWVVTSMLTANGAFTPNQAGVYNLAYTLGSGSCQNSDLMVMTVHTLPTVSAGADAEVCVGLSIQLNGSGSSNVPFAYQWNNSNYLNNSTSGQPTATVQSTTNFILTVTDNHGCSASDDMNLTVVAMPVAGFTHVPIGCVNTSIPFANASTSAVSYTWSFGNSNNSTSSNPQATYLVNGIYNITLTANNSLGCSNTSNSSIEIIGVPSAAFSLSSTSGCSPLAVNFTNTSTGSFINYDWNFGSTTSTQMTPAALNFTSGVTSTNYPITLTTTNICGSHSYASNVLVLPQPVASFSTDLSSLCSPVTTVFTNSSAGNPSSFHWDLGDGDTTNDPVPEPKVYITEDNSEDFVITLVATNVCGTDSAQTVVTVLPNTVEMNLQPTATEGCSPLFVTFNNFTTGATNYEYVFGDNSSSTLMSPNHIYSDAGTYTVAHYANDGCSYDTTLLTIVVLPSPSISISADENSVCPNENVHFHSQTTGTIQSIEWNFDDTGTSTGADTEHSFVVGNTYFVSATATATNGCPASGSLSYEVHPQPQPIMNLDNTMGCSPLNVCSSNGTSGASTFYWNFGNGYTTNDMNACQNFVNTTFSPIEYTISLDAQNSFGCSGHEEQNITVQPQPVTSFTLGSYSSCFPLDNVLVNVNTQGSSGYAWYDNGNLISNASVPILQFATNGNHIVQLVASNDMGCTDSDQQLYVVHPTPVINIMPNTFNGCAPLIVNFENETSDGITWAWSFSNGEQSVLQNPELIFIEPGLYNVQLTATSQYGCTSQQVYDEMIEVFEVPVAAFGFTPEGDIIYQLDVEFADSSLGATQYNWDFGDGFASNEMSPTHHFERGGYYEVTQKVTNAFGCIATQMHPVNIDNTFYVYIPNSFSPNDDGINDLFIPSFSSKEEIREFEFIVMNRWGEVIFKTDDPETGWHGNALDGEYYTHNDVFTWSMKLSFNNKQVDRNYAGSVLAVR